MTIKQALALSLLLGLISACSNYMRDSEKENPPCAPSGITAVQVG